MIIIPAVDIKDGKCVRLKQGRAEAMTTYSDDPLAMAKRWESEGAELLHVVDLDGAFTGAPKNRDKVVSIIQTLKIPVQIGGGIRDDALIAEMISAGAARVIVGTRAVEDPGWLKMISEKHPGKIVMSLDAKGGHLAQKGWTSISTTSIGKYLLTIKDFPIRAIVYTDITRDGMLGGPDVKGLLDLMQFVKIPIIASGGMSSLADVKAIAGIGLEGVIIGKALYAGNVQLADAIALTKQSAPKNK